VTGFAGVAFDCFGTLIEIRDDRRVTTRIRRQLAKRTRVEGGAPLTDDVSIRDSLLMHGVERRIAEEIGADAAVEASSARPIRGAVEAVHAARSSGIAIAIVSNLSQDYSDVVSRWFPDVPSLLSFETGFAKPDPRMFEAARSQLGKGPLLMVGDSRRCDHHGAIACGFSAVLIASGPVPETTSIKSVAALARHLGWVAG
jgi:FMN phosphatase YigB (HAD superfamily)